MRRNSDQAWVLEKIKHFVSPYALKLYYIYIIQLGANPGKKNSATIISRENVAFVPFQSLKFHFAKIGASEELER